MAEPINRITILVTAYAVNPFKGSENGMGWNFTRQLLRWYNVILLTRENNVPHVLDYIELNPQPEYDHLKVVGFDLPPEQRFWKKGEMLSLVYYYLWQRKIVPFIKRQKWSFSLVYNLNFHNDWTPSFLWKLGKPFIWGPIGHHPPIPYKTLGIPPSWKNRLAEWIKSCVKTYFWKYSNTLAQTLKHADYILPMNSDVAKQLSFEGKNYRIFPSVGFGGYKEETQLPVRPKNTFRILSVGRFVELKGFEVLIHSISAFKKLIPATEHTTIEVSLIGKGPLRDKLEKLIKELGLSHMIRIHDWLPYEEVIRHYQHADVFFFPSFEGAGMVMAEAMAAKLPILCWNNSGPGELLGKANGIRIPYDTWNTSITRFAQALFDLYSRPSLRTSLGIRAKNRFDQHLEWNKKGEILHEIVEDILADHKVSTCNHILISEKTN